MQESEGIPIVQVRGTQLELFRSRTFIGSGTRGRARTAAQWVRCYNLVYHTLLHPLSGVQLIDIKLKQPDGQPSSRLETSMGPEQVD